MILLVNFIKFFTIFVCECVCICVHFVYWLIFVSRLLSLGDKRALCDLSAFCDFDYFGINENRVYDVFIITRKFRMYKYTPTWFIHIES